MINFKIGEVVGFVKDGVPTMFKVVNIMPCTSPDGDRYYGHDINGKAVAAHKMKLYSPPAADIQYWEENYKE